jgi:uncharacterized paraquat-inducible protein A
MKTIFLRCAGCRARIKAPVLLRGQTRACPGCGHRFVVQPQPPQDAGPALVLDTWLDSQAMTRGRTQRLVAG